MTPHINLNSKPLGKFTCIDDLKVGTILNNFYAVNLFNVTSHMDLYSKPLGKFTCIDDFKVGTILNKTILILALNFLCSQCDTSHQLKLKTFGKIHMY